KPMNTIVWYDTAKTLIYPSFFTNWDPAVNYVPFPEGTDLKNIPADIMSQGKKKILLNNRLYIRNGRGAYVSVLGL
ncbi:MAG: hypothetical protein MJZ75_07320, partial [Paludibacteraceae bacterium]|nr:hypothetical protein [Paludibacteraceae bacterium]